MNSYNFLRQTLYKQNTRDKRIKNRRWKSPEKTNRRTPSFYAFQYTNIPLESVRQNTSTAFFQRDSNIKITKMTMQSSWVVYTVPFLYETKAVNHMWKGLRWKIIAPLDRLRCLQSLFYWCSRCDCPLGFHLDSPWKSLQWHYKNYLIIMTWHALFQPRCRMAWKKKTMRMAWYRNKKMDSKHNLRLGSTPWKRRLANFNTQYLHLWFSDSAV